MQRKCIGERECVSSGVEEIEGQCVSSHKGITKDSQKIRKIVATESQKIHKRVTKEPQKHHKRITK